MDLETMGDLNGVGLGDTNGFCLEQCILGLVTTKYMTFALLALLF